MPWGVFCVARPRRTVIDRFVRPGQGAGGSGTVEQVTPLVAGRCDRDAVRLVSPVMLCDRDKGIGQAQRADIVVVGGLHDFGERLVEAAASQRDDHALGGVEHSGAGPRGVLGRIR